MKPTVIKKNNVIVDDIECKIDVVIKNNKIRINNEDPILVKSKGAKAKHCTVTFMKAVTEVEHGNREARHTAPKTAAFNDNELETINAGTP